MNQVTQAVILAAGLGTRLKSLTNHTPKALMPIAGEPAIARIIRQLVRYGVHDIAINIHHHAKQIQHTLGNGTQFNANLYYSYEETLLDSGGGARTALALLPEGEHVYIHNADILSDIDLDILADLDTKQGCALALVPNPKHHPQGDFALDGRLLTTPNPTSSKVYTFSGVSLWHKPSLLAYPKHQAFSLVEPIKQHIQAQQCVGFVHRGFWFDIGRPHDLVQANRFYHRQGL